MPAPVMLIPVAGLAAELTARTALLGGAVYWKIEIDDDNDGTYTDMTGYLENNQVSIRASGSIFQPTTSAAVELVFRNSPKVFTEGQMANMPAKISCKVGATAYFVVFTGYVSAQGCRRAKTSLTGDSVTVTLYDPSQSRGMKRKCLLESYVGYDICDTGATATSIAYVLAAMMGLAAGDCDFLSINYVKDYLSLDGSMTPYQELQDLAIQYGAFLGFRYDGKLRLTVWTDAEWNTPTPEYVFDSTNVHSFTAVGGDLFCNKAWTEYETYEVLAAGQIIYKNYDSWDETIGQNAIVVAAGEYWPGAAAADSVGRLEYGYGTEKWSIGKDIVTPTIGATGSGSDIESTGGLLTLTSFNGSTAATRQNAGSSEIILRNATGSPVTITKFQVRGTPVRITAKNRIDHEDAAIGSDSEIVEQQIPGKYATSVASSKVTVRRWVDFGKTARKEYDAVVDYTPHLQLGAIVTFNPTADVNLDCVVIDYGHRSAGPHANSRTTIRLLERVNYNATGLGVVTARPAPMIKVEAGNITLAAVTAPAVADGAVSTTAKIVDGIVSNAKMIDDTLQASKIDIANFINLSETGLVSYLSFDDGPGATIARDHAAVPNDGTITGATSDPEGKSGACLSFDAATEKVLLANEGTFGFEYNTPFSVSEWIYINAITSGGYPISKQANVSPRTGWSISSAGDGRFFFQLQNYDVTYIARVKTTDAMIAALTWCHIVVTHDGSGVVAGMKMYVNGLQCALTTINNTLGGRTILNNLPVEVGNRQGSTNFDGKIDEVRIYNRVLSAAEVKFLFEFPAGRNSTMIMSDRIVQRSVVGNQIAKSVLTAEHLAFGDDLYGVLGDISLPTGYELFDFAFPDRVSNQDRRPLLGNMATYEPPLIGATANSRVKWANRGCTGLWDAVTNMVAHANCTETDNPHITGETPAADSNATLVLSTERESLDEFTCRKFAITSGGTIAISYLSSNDAARLNGFVAGSKYTLQAEVFVPATGGPAVGEIVLVLSDYHAAAWDRTPSDTPATTGQWLKISVTKTIDAGAAGVRAYLEIASTASSGEYVYLRNVMIALEPYAGAFCPASRNQCSLGFYFTHADEGMIEGWFAPRWNYDTAVNKLFWCIGLASGSYIALYYQAADDKIVAELFRAASNNRQKTTAALNAATLNVWMHLKVSWDISASAIVLLRDGVNQATAVSAGTVTTMVPSGQLVFGNSYGGTTLAGLLMADVAYVAAYSTTAPHGLETRPYFDPAEVANSNQSVRISKKGIRMHNAALSITDKWGRLIDISNSTGMLARDAGGTIIHDIPNSLVLASHRSLGHLFLSESPGTIDDQTIIYTNTDTSKGILVRYNKDISAVLPPGLTNVKSISVFCLTTVFAEAAKVAIGTSLIGALIRGIYYDTDPGTGNVIKWTGAVASVDGVALEIATGSSSVIPVNYVAGVPYITWAGYMSFANMLNASGIYYVQNLITYQGYGA